jgi:hypothetical protein
MDGLPVLDPHNVAHINPYVSSLERLAARCVAVSISKGFLFAARG